MKKKPYHTEWYMKCFLVIFTDCDEIQDLEVMTQCFQDEIKSLQNRVDTLSAENNYCVNKVSQECDSILKNEINDILTCNCGD